MSMEQQSRARADFRISLLVALAWVTAGSAAMVTATAVQPQLWLHVGDLEPTRSTALSLMMSVLAPAWCAAAVLCAVALLGTRRLFRSPLIAGSAAAALPVVPVVIGLVSI